MDFLLGFWLPIENVDAEIYLSHAFKCIQFRPYNYHYIINISTLFMIPTLNMHLACVQLPVVPVLICFIMFCLNLKVAQVTFHIQILRKIEMLKLYFNIFLSLTILIKFHYCNIVHFNILLFF